MQGKEKEKGMKGEEKKDKRLFHTTLILTLVLTKELKGREMIRKNNNREL